MLLGVIDGQSGFQKAFIKVIDISLGDEAYANAVTFQFPRLRSNMADLGIWRNVPSSPPNRSVHHNYLPFQCTQEDAAISFGLFLEVGWWAAACHPCPVPLAVDDTFLLYAYDA